MLPWNNILWQNILGYTSEIVWEVELIDFLVFEWFNLSSYETSSDKTGFVIQNHNLYDMMTKENTSFQQITRDGWVVTNTRFSSHSITLDIGIIAHTQSELLDMIQTLKTRLNVKNGYLYTNYGGKRIRTKVNIESVTLPTNFYWERLLITDRKWAVQVQMTRLDHWEEIDVLYTIYPSLTSSTNIVFDVQGWAEVFPKFIFIILSWWTNLTKFEISINGYLISYTGTFVDGDRMEFDFKNETIKKNVSEVVWSGIFKQLQLWGNEISFNFTSSGAFDVETQAIYNKILL